MRLIQSFKCQLIQDGSLQTTILKQISRKERTNEVWYETTSSWAIIMWPYNLSCLVNLYYHLTHTSNNLESNEMTVKNIYISVR